MERLNPLNDYLFMKMLGETGAEEELRQFLNSVLSRTRRAEIVSLIILNDTKLPAEIVGDKTSILDIRAILEDGTHVNCEVQIKRVAGLDRRLLQYWARDYSRSLSAGEEYDKIPSVIAIIITEFEMIKLPDFHTSFHLREDKNPSYIFSDALEMHVVDISKFRRLPELDIAGNPLHRWLTFLDRYTPDETLKEVLRMDQAIQKANERIAFVMQDKEALRRYQMYELQMSDWTSGISLAREEGREEGAISVAKNALSKGLDDSFVAEITGLDIEVINKLRREITK